MIADYAPSSDKPREFHELIELEQDELTELEAAYVLYIVRRARVDFATFCFACYPGYAFPPHLQTLCDTLNTVEHTPNARVMVTCPPRHGKSLTCSVLFPGWFLGRNPDKKMITASYIGALTGQFASQVRDIMEGKAYQLIFPEIKIKGRARGGWGIVNHKGGLMSTGVTSAMTGFGADCLPGETLIRTESGVLQLRTLIQSWYNTGAAPRVLSYDHAGALVYRRVLAVAERTDDEFYRITTERGKAFRATGNHRVYVDGVGYRRVSELVVGDCVLSVRQGKASHKSSLQGVLRQSASQHDSGNVRQLWGHVRAQGLRACQAITQGFHALLLHQCVSAVSSSHARLSALPYLRQANQQRARQEVLQPRVHPFAQDVGGSHLFCLRCGVPTKDTSHYVLQQCVCGFCPRRTYGWFRQFALQGWRKLCQVVQGDAPADSGARWARLRRLRRWGTPDTERAQWYMVKSDHSPHQRASFGQSGGQFDYSVSYLSRHSPQIEHDSISCIERVSGITEPVYDIQVEGTSNFFAGDVLVHNCMIIDDPIRDALFADSPTWRQHLWDWFTSTAYTRLHPGAPVFLIATRWHHDDLSGRLINSSENDPEAAKWSEVFFEATNSKTGQALWPERYDEKALRQIKATVGSRVWNALYQGRPTPDEGGLFKRWMFRKVLKLLPVDKKYRFCRYWDKAGTENGGDYTVGALMAIDEDKRIYLVHVVRGQWSALEREQIIEATAKQDFARYSALGRYTVGVEQEPGSGGKESAEGTIRRLAGFRVKADKPEGELTTRADPFAAQMEAGNVYLVEGEWIEPLVDEFCQFPLGKHDDQIAAYCGAFKVLTGIKAFRYELL